MLPAAEAVEALSLRVDDERRVADLVKWAPGTVVLSARVELNVACDEVFDSGGTLEPVDLEWP